MRRKQKRTTEAVPVTPRQFVQAWQESASLAEVAQKVRSKKNACRVRAYRYRQRGVPLKEFPPVEIEATDWDELADYAASLVPDEPEDDNVEESGDREARPD
jgi:hypothetical protein